MTAGVPRRRRTSLRGLLARLVAAVAGVLLVLIAVAGAGTLITASDYRDAGELAVQRQEAANQLLVDLLDAETGNRGYTLNPRGDYLLPYTEARRRYPDDLARLMEVVAGEPTLERQVTELDLTAQRWFTEARELVRLRRQGRQGEALRRINQGIAKTYIDEFRRGFAQLREGVEEARLAALEEADRRRDLTLFAIVLSALLALVVLVSTTRQLWARIGGPIGQLALGVGRVARGRLAEPVPTTPGAVRELAQLTQGFNTMQRQVLQQREAVAAAARREVAQRTERRLWETVQTGLLPSRLPRYPGYRVVARYRSADAELLVGGDFYDAEVLPDGRLAVLVGDMAGHGAASAAQAAGLRFGWRTLLAVDPAPSTVLPALNRQLARPELRADGLFASLLHLVIGPDGTGEFALAGHPPPLVLSADGCAELLPDGIGPLLGVMDRAAWPVTAVRLAPGETLVAFTDGLIEARRAPAGANGGGASEVFGVARACEILERESRAAVQARVERLVDAARRHDGGRLRDDVVVLAVERIRTPL
ncbi:MAG TPA: SpoIIE family protein phosphatase [Miltoncostaeaceae bacterium]|nr:SpoIIE family protein phosphatase [Miltoncostaeaceae bacterium]